jgi:helix-turn-helix protein
VEHMDDSADEILAEVEADDYYAIVPEWVLFHPDLSHGAVRLYGVLRRFADQRGIAFPGLSAIGEKYAVTPRSVTRHMDELIAAGAVTKKRRVGARGSVTSNLYRVHSRPTFIQVEHAYTPDTSAAVKKRAEARAEVSDGDSPQPSDKNVRRGTDKNVRRPSDKNVRLTTATTNHSQDEPQGSAALRAATAEHVETSSSSSKSRNASERAAAAAATGSADDDHGDAPRATNNNPDQILSAMMLNPDEAARFRAWLVNVTNAKNPDGLIITLHTSGRLSERLQQWRASETFTRTVSGSPSAARGHLAWCGDCDRQTRTAVTTDAEGREYVRRCPACNINASPVQVADEPATPESEEFARDAYEAARAARAALPAGVRRRRTIIGTVTDIATVRAAQMSDQ